MINHRESTTLNMLILRSQLCYPRHAENAPKAKREWINKNTIYQVKLARRKMNHL